MGYSAQRWRCTHWSDAGGHGRSFFTSSRYTQREEKKTGEKESSDAPVWPLGADDIPPDWLASMRDLSKFVSSTHTRTTGPPSEPNSAQVSPPPPNTKFHLQNNDKFVEYH